MQFSFSFPIYSMYIFGAFGFSFLSISIPSAFFFCSSVSLLFFFSFTFSLPSLPFPSYFPVLCPFLSFLFLFPSPFSFPFYSPSSIHLLHALRFIKAGGRTSISAGDDSDHDQNSEHTVQCLLYSVLDCIYSMCVTGVVD